MSSSKQIEANRLNSLRSTGPKTPEGKQISAQNASKLGIFSRELLLSSENADELQMLARAIRADLKPEGAVEFALVEIIVSALWRLRRFFRIEHGLFEMYKHYKGVDGGPSVAFAHDASQLDCFSRLARMETTSERRLYKALSELKQLQRHRLQAKGRPVIDLESTHTEPAAAGPKPEQTANGWRRWLGV